MHFAIYTKSTEAWEAMFSALESAKKSIWIEMSTFVDDFSGEYNFVSLLEQQARKGLEVILILDAFGSMNLSHASIDRLRKTGVEIIFFRHWLYHTHRKLIIIDHSLALLGGVNIVRHALRWKDLLIEIDGNLVLKLARTFIRTYTIVKGKKQLTLPSQKKKKLSRTLRSWVMEHTPIASRKKLKKYYLKKIQSAKKSLCFVTPYFVPSRWFREAIKDALKRGVSVTLFVPKTTDMKFFDMLNMYYLNLVIEPGVIIYQIPTMNHAKALLIDDREAMIGSGNLDAWAFERNNEIGIFSIEQNFVDGLQKVIQEWKDESQLLTPEDVSLPWYHHVLGIFWKLLNPIL